MFAYKGQLVCALALALLSAGCSDSNPVTPPAADMTANATPGGPVTGALDDHCAGDGGAIVQTTSQSSCTPPPGTPADTELDYGDTMYNTSGDDDDCKYHVSFKATPVYENQAVTFTVTATRTVDGKPVTGADTLIESFLSATHPAPNANTKTVESPPGTYTIGPVLFDQAGMWTVRFHLFESCSDALPDSPHGHAAFYINVP